MELHPNSKKITIFRAGSFITNAQSSAQEFMALSKRSIGSYWQSSQSKGIGSGLSFEEIDLLMPRVLDIPKEDRTFRQAVRNYFASLVTTVPYGKGRELEIGLSKSNSVPLSENNLPIKIDEYIRYRHAIGHPRVSMNLEQAKGDKSKEFYIFDKEKAIENNATKDALNDEALGYYMAVRNDPAKINQLLTLLNIDPKSIKGKDAPAVRLQKLREKAVNDSATFVKIYKIDNFEDRFLIQSMLNAGILKKIGEQIVDRETSEIIGHTLEEAVFTLKDKTKSGMVTILKQRLQEANKELAVSTPKKVKDPEPEMNPEETTE